MLSGERAAIFGRCLYATAWCAAAIRLQRCSAVKLRVRGQLRETIHRSRGALTGNALASWLGVIVVEDALLAADTFTSRFDFKFLGVQYSLGKKKAFIYKMDFA